MGYGVNRWVSTTTRARPAARRRKSAPKAAKSSKSRTAKRAPKTRRASRPAKPAKKKSRKRSTVSRPRAVASSAKKYKLYSRITGEKILVSKNDPRREDTDTYSTRKLSAKTLRKNQVAAALGSNAITRSVLDTPAAQTAAATLAVGASSKALKALPRAARAAIATIGAGGAQVAAEAGVSAALGTASIVGILAAAGLGSYFTTRYILNSSTRRDEALAKASDAYRQAKQQAAQAAGYGRDEAYRLPSQVLKALSEQYKAVTSEIKQARFTF